MQRSPTNYPTRKVLGASGGYGVGKAFSTVLIYFLEQAFGHPLPGEVRFGCEALIEAGLTFLGGYLMPPD